MSDNARAWARREKLEKADYKKHKLPRPNPLKGTYQPTMTNRYKAEDGFYYNGYFCSPDMVNKAWGSK